MPALRTTQGLFDDCVLFVIEHEVYLLTPDSGRKPVALLQAERAAAASGSKPLQEMTVAMGECLGELRLTSRSIPGFEQRRQALERDRAYRFSEQGAAEFLGRSLTRVEKNLMMALEAAFHEALVVGTQSDPISVFARYARDAARGRGLEVEVCSYWDLKPYYQRVKWGAKPR